MIYNLKHITIQQYYALEDATLFAKYLKLEELMQVRDNKFGKYKASEFGDLSYGEVGLLKRLVSAPTLQGLSQIFNIVYSIELADYYKQDIVEYFYGLKWIKQEIGRIIKQENSTLSHEPDAKFELAGGKKLNAFGDYPSLVMLAKQYGCFPEEIEERKYNIVFADLAYIKVYGDIAKAYRELK